MAGIDVVGMDHDLARPPLGGGLAVPPPGQERDPAIRDPVPGLPVIHAMRRGQHQLGRNQRSGAEPRPVKVHAAHALPAAAPVRGIEGRQAGGVGAVDRADGDINPDRNDKQRDKAHSSDLFTGYWVLAGIAPRFGDIMATKRKAWISRAPAGAARPWPSPAVRPCAPRASRCRRRSASCSRYCPRRSPRAPSPPASAPCGP